jgi:hypothetical protein
MFRVGYVRTVFLFGVLLLVGLGLLWLVFKAWRE